MTSAESQKLGTNPPPQPSPAPPFPLRGRGEGAAQVDPSRLRAAVGTQPLVVKLGGSVGGEDTLPEDVAQLQGLGARVVLVHGGGPLITQWLARLGKETRFVSGLRYTDEETLEVARMVLAGLVNGEIVARLGAAGARAVGLSGSDDRLLQAKMRDDSTGLVGNVTRVNPEPVRTLLEVGYAVVVAPVAVDEQGRFLNVNADTAAAEIAAALAAHRLIFLTDVPRVSDGSGATPPSTLRAEEARDLMARGVIDGGMIPKVQACIRILSVGGVGQIVDGRQPHALLQALAHPSEIGTTVVPA